jgi:hypothetical protein
VISRDEAELWRFVTCYDLDFFFQREPGMIDTQKTSDAERYSDTAEVMREVARRAHSPEIRDVFFALADCYDRLAEQRAFGTARTSATRFAPNGKD